MFFLVRTEFGTLGIAAHINSSANTGVILGKESYIHVLNIDKVSAVCPVTVSISSRFCASREAIRSPAVSLKIPIP